MSFGVLDSDSEYVKGLVKVLDDLGFQTYVFNKEDSFEKEYTKSRFDVVLLSWGLGGERVCESIKKVGEPYPSVIVGGEGGGTVSIHLSIPAVGFLFIPYDAEHLMNTLLKAVENRYELD